MSVLRFAGKWMSSIVAWALLVIAWVRVVMNGTAPSLLMLLAPVLIALATAAVIRLWVRHNLELQHRLGPRRSVCEVVRSYELDRLGRQLTLAPALVTTPSWREARLLESNGHKYYFSPG